MRFALALILALLLAACQSAAPKPEIVYVTITKTVPVDDALTRDCYNERPQEQSHFEAKRLANLRDESLDECTGRMREIRALGR